MSARHGSADILADQPLRLSIPQAELIKPPDNRRFFDENTRKPFGAAPVDKLTKVPLLLSPSFMQGLPEADWDDNHVMFSKKRPELTDSLGNALKRSRIQRVNSIAHRGYFHKYVGQPDIPMDDAQRMSTVVMHLAGYVPEKTLSFVTTPNGTMMIKRPIRRGIQQGLVESGMVKVDDPYETAKHLGRHILSKYVFNLPRGMYSLEEQGYGLETDTAEDLLGYGSKKETAHVEDLYGHVRAMGYIATGSPKSAHELILGFIHDNGFANAVDVFANKPKREAAA